MILVQLQSLHCLQVLRQQIQHLDIEPQPNQPNGQQRHGQGHPNPAAQSEILNLQWPIFNPFTVGVSTVPLKSIPRSSLPYSRSLSSTFPGRADRWSLYQSSISTPG